MRLFLFVLVLFVDGGCLHTDEDRKQIIQTLAGATAATAEAMETLSKKESIGISDLVQVGIGVLFGGGLTGGTVFAVKNGRKK